MQIIFEDLFQIIDSGPSVRRSFLDWGLFHVEPSYYRHFFNYKKSLTQRNILLKNHSSDVDNLNAWEQSMASSGLILNDYRHKYLEILLPKFKDTLAELNSTIDINVKYHHGWGQSLEELNQSEFCSTLKVLKG